MFLCKLSRVVGLSLVGASLCGVAAYVPAALACGGGVAAAPSGTSIDDLPYTEAFQIMVTWPEELDGPAVVSVGASIHNATDGFGYVVPIPQVIDSSALSVGDGDLLDALASFTGPRSLRHTCFDYRPGVVYACPPPRSGGEGEGEGGASSDLGKGVFVETTLVGAYEVSLLTADGATGLLSWLEANDFALPEGSDVHIEQYIEQGFMFAAVNVPPGTEVEDGASLPPLNFALTEGFRTLPLLLAANAAQTPQDVLVTTWAPNLGAVGISNLAEVDVEDDCMAREPNLGEAYGAAIEQAHLEAGEAIWFLEFYRQNGISQQYGEVTSEVGLSDDHEAAMASSIGTVDEVGQVGRIHIRYSPGQLIVDPAFYAHSTSDFEALEYIEFVDALTRYVKVCGEGMVDEGATCSSTRVSTEYCTDDAKSDGDLDKGGCATAGSSNPFGWLALSLVMLLGACRRELH